MIDVMEVIPTSEPSPQKISGIFKCFQCDFKCGTSVDLKEHYQVHRSEFPYKCFQCSYDGKDAEDFKQHSLTHFEQSYYKCPKCDFKAKYRQNITNHIRYTHKQICACGIQFKSPKEFSEHLLDHPECKENIDQNEANDEESTEKIKSKKFKTSDSDKNVDDKDMSDQVFVCQICFYIFRGSEELNEHTLNVHSSEVRSIIASNEESEENSDTEQQPPDDSDPKFFLCGECHFIFSSTADLDAHLQTHENSRPEIELAETIYPKVEINESDTVEYVCYICDKAFASEKAVKLHMGHHAAIKFRCPKCGISMKSQIALKAHMATHPSIKTAKTLEKNRTLQQKLNDKEMYKCASCPYQSKFHDSLQIHLTTHSKRDPSKRKIKPTFKVKFGGM